jgi:hypothetical protein
VNHFLNSDILSFLYFATFRFYLVNYLEFGKTWQELDKEENDPNQAFQVFIKKIILMSLLIMMFDLKLNFKLNLVVLLVISNFQ